MRLTTIGTAALGICVFAEGGCSRANGSLLTSTGVEVGDRVDLSTLVWIKGTQPKGDLTLVCVGDCFSCADLSRPERLRQRLGNVIIITRGLTAEVENIPSRFQRVASLPQAEYDHLNQIPTIRSIRISGKGKVLDVQGLHDTDDAFIQRGKQK